MWFPCFLIDLYRKAILALKERHDQGQWEERAERESWVQCVMTQSAILARAALQWFMNKLRHLSDSPPASSLQTTHPPTHPDSYLTDWLIDRGRHALQLFHNLLFIILPHISNLWITTGVFNGFWRTISKYLMDVFFSCYCAGTAKPMHPLRNVCLFYLTKICYMKYVFNSGYLIFCSISKQFTNMINVLAKIFESLLINMNKVYLFIL